LLSGVRSAMKGLFFPQEQGCPICGRRGSSRHICRICLEEWAELADGLFPCAKCGRFKKVEAGKTTCQECRDDGPPYSIARSVVPYEGSVRDALHNFKFCGMRELAYPLGELITSLVASLFPYRLPHCFQTASGKGTFRLPHCSGPRLCDSYPADLGHLFCHNFSILQ
jgi:predicted amidophosphoribosyltransferase